MLNKNKKSDFDIINEMEHNSNLNSLKRHKPFPFYGIVLIMVALIIGLVLMLISANSFSHNQITFIGIICSTAISFFAIIYTINKEERVNYRLAQKSARSLAIIIKSIWDQIKRVESGFFHKIVYQKNWIDYYDLCSSYLEYDYTEFLLREFEIVDSINSCIALTDKDQLSELIKNRRRIITDGTQNFDIYSIYMNLVLFSSGSKELKPWKLEKGYREFDEFFISKYSGKVKELTVQYLQENNNSCDIGSASYYVMEKIRQESELKNGKYKFEVIQNKKLLYSIFKIYLNLDKYDSFSLCWGELTLNDQ